MKIKHEISATISLTQDDIEAIKTLMVFCDIKKQVKAGVCVITGEDGVTHPQKMIEKATVVFDIFDGLTSRLGKNF